MQKFSSTWNYTAIPSRKWSQESIADFLLCAFRGRWKSAQNVPPVEWKEESNLGLLCWEGDILSPLKDMDNVLKPVCLSLLHVCMRFRMHVIGVNVSLCASVPISVSILALRIAKTFSQKLTKLLQILLYNNQ